MRRKANTLFAGFPWTGQITKRQNKPQPDYSTMASRPSHILHPLVLQLSVALLPTPLWGIQAWNIKSQTIKYNNKEKANDEMEFNILGLLQKL